MKKKSVLQVVDAYTESVFGKNLGVLKYVIQIGGIITILLGTWVLAGYLWYINANPELYQIENDLQEIEKIVSIIDKQCDVRALHHSIVAVDFLDSDSVTEHFPLELAFPEKWMGPYLQENIKFQGRLYRLIHTKFGVFIVPGDGVILPNNLRVGSDVVIDSNTDISALMKRGQPLRHKGTLLARKVSICTLTENEDQKED